MPDVAPGTTRIGRESLVLRLVTKRTMAAHDPIISAAPLPIDAVLDDLRAMLAAHTSAVLVAPPGAGKTTRVPLALLDAPWLDPCV